MDMTPGSKHNDEHDEAQKKVFRGYGFRPGGIKILIFGDPVIPGCWQYSPWISMPSAMSTHLSNLSMYECASPFELQ